jgi:hypothetical protein
MRNLKKFKKKNFAKKYHDEKVFPKILCNYTFNECLIVNLCEKHNIMTIFHINWLSNDDNAKT